MASYSVLTKEAPSSMTLVRDGFSFVAFLLGPVSYAWNRAWAGVVVWLLGAACIVALSFTFGVAPGGLVAAILAFMFLMGLEASEFRRRSLIRRGYRVADMVEARNQNEAEVRFLSRRLSAPEMGGPPHMGPRVAANRTESVGLFLTERQS